MRTKIINDDGSIDKAKKLGKFKTNKEAVEKGVRLKQQEKIRKYRGKLKWEGNLDEMRTDR